MSQDVFQHYMDQIIERCPGVVGIADDVVTGATEKEHDENLINLFEVAKELEKVALCSIAKNARLKNNRFNFLAKFLTVQGYIQTL